MTNPASKRTAHAWILVFLAAAIITQRVAAAHAAAPAGQRYTLCAASAINAQNLGRIQSALHTRLLDVPGISTVQVARASSRCVRVAMTARGDRTGAVVLAGKVGNVVIADSERDQLDPGARVRLVCSKPGCSFGVKVGRANPAAKLPILNVILSARDVKQGSAAVGRDNGGLFHVAYAFTKKSDHIWCAFTSRHVNRMAAVVVDGVVIENPMIQSPIYGIASPIFALQNSTQAYALAGYLNTGPLPIGLRVQF